MKERFKKMLANKIHLDTETTFGETLKMPASDRIGDIPASVVKDYMQSFNCTKDQALSALQQKIENCLEIPR